jgi:murein DD-endopeptidase MepM/ murein hydrolase activator NlpD
MSIVFVFRALGVDAPILWKEASDTVAKLQTLLVRHGIDVDEAERAAREFGGSTQYGAQELLSRIQANPKLGEAVRADARALFAAAADAPAAVVTPQPVPPLPESAPAPLVADSAAPPEPASAPAKPQPVRHSNPVEAEVVRVTSAFGRRPNPFRFAKPLTPVAMGGSGDAFHKGIDMIPSNGRCNQPILATAGGKVKSSTYSPTYGNHVIITHPDSTETLYAHMTGEGMPSKGQNVERGQVIGYMGNSGLSAGCHLHYEQRDANGKPVPPVIDGERMRKGVQLAGAMPQLKTLPGAPPAIDPMASPEFERMELASLAVPDASPSDASPSISASVLGDIAPTRLPTPELSAPEGREF